MAAQEPSKLLVRVRSPSPASVPVERPWRAQSGSIPSRFNPSDDFSRRSASHKHDLHYTTSERRARPCLVHRKRGALSGEPHVHCYRMLGSFGESEDLVQEAFLRAWRRRETFEGRSSLRAWLYK